MTTAASEEEKKERTGFNLEVYQLADGWWSFRINGKESRYRSSNPEGLQRTIKLLLHGRPANSVTLKAATAGGTVKAEKPAAGVATSDWAACPTMLERIEAFLHRGKLGKPVT